MIKEIKWIDLIIKRQRKYLQDTSNSFLINELKKEIKSLKRIKDRLEENQKLKEQLKNAIIPKFKIGQEVWATTSDNKGVMGGEIKCCILEDKLYYIVALWKFEEQELFATKEEAEEKLQELKRIKE